MHAASPVSVTWICSTAPSPATFPAAVTVFPEMLIVGDPTKLRPGNTSDRHSRRHECRDECRK